jgi:hypothetical protein
VSQAEIAAEEVQALLLSAVAEGNFARVSDIAARYKQTIENLLVNADAGSISLDNALKPLQHAIQCLRVVRAQQASEFQKLVVSSRYSASVPIVNTGTLKLDA